MKAGKPVDRDDEGVEEEAKEAEETEETEDEKIAEIEEELTALEEFDLVMRSGLRGVRDAEETDDDEEKIEAEEDSADELDGTWLDAELEDDLGEIEEWEE